MSCGENGGRLKLERFGVRDIRHGSAVHFLHSYTATVRNLFCVLCQWLLG